MKNKWNKRLHTPFLYICTTVTGQRGMRNAIRSIRPSVDGLYSDGTVHISRDMHKYKLDAEPG